MAENSEHSAEPCSSETLLENENSELDSDRGPNDQVETARTDSAVSKNLKIIYWIMGGLLVWGLIHTIGVYVSSANADIRKPILVYSCVFAFLGFWAVMIRMKMSESKEPFG